MLVASNLLFRVSFLSCPVLVLLPVSDYLVVFSCCYPTLLLVFIVLSFSCQSSCLCPVLCIPEFYVYSLGHFGGFGGRLKPVTCLRIFKAFSSDWAGCRLCSHITYVRPDLPVTAKKWASKGEQSVCSCVSEVHVTSCSLVRVLKFGVSERDGKPQTTWQRKRGWGSLPPLLSFL